jgi:hypothetical protein
MADFKNMRIGLCPIDCNPTFPYAGQAGNTIFLDGAADRVEYRFQAEKSATIVRLGFRVATTAGNPPSYIVSLQGITNGEANGVIAGSATFTPPAAFSANDWRGKWIWVDITPTSVTQGNFYAMVIQYSSGTVNISNMIEILTSLDGTDYKRFPGVAAGTAASLATSSYHPIFGLKDSDGEVYGSPLQTSYTYTNQIELPYPKQQAIAFTLPAGFGTEFKVAGIHIMGALPTGANTTTYKVELFDGQDVISNLTMYRGLQTEDNHPDWAGNAFIFYFDESTLASLIFGRTYYISIQNNDAAMASLSWDYFTVLDADDQEGWPGGQYFAMANRDISSQETDEETPNEWQLEYSKRPLCEFILSEWGGPGLDIEGAHLKFTPAWNDNVLIQHADDRINKTPDLGAYEPHESYGLPIGNCIESYSGYLTVEVYSNPDTDRSENSLIVNEKNIEDLKVINLEPWEDGVYELVFRLRAKRGSPYYKEVTRFLRVIT